ncbi:MAG: DUF2282 domain-containing protein [Rhodospirillales bacterium]|nr:DUF2282 domain-containing protein [Rhodospirillales bacterium]
MDRRTFATTVLGSAVGLAAAAKLTDASAQMMKLPPGANMAVVKENMARAKKYHLVACYGINAVGRNDCAAGAHSCAGQATIARDPKSFVLLPVGDCQKIAGGSLKPF